VGSRSAAGGRLAVSSYTTGYYVTLVLYAIGSVTTGSFCRRERFLVEPLPKGLRGGGRRTARIGTSRFLGVARRHSCCCGHRLGEGSSGATTRIYCVCGVLVVGADERRLA